MVVVLALVGTALIAFQWDEPIAHCMVAYRNARTAGDTAAVDKMANQSGKAPFRETCGDFRRNGSLARYEREHGR